jgi:hypothetical protein
LKKTILISTFVVVAWAVAVLVMTSDGVGFADTVVYFFGGLALGTFAVVTTAAAFGHGAVAKQWPVASEIALLVVQLAIIAAVAGSVVLDVPFAARFAASRSALEAAALRTRAAHQPAVPGTIGLFRVTEIDRAGSAVRFIVGDAGLFNDSAGVVYSPDGQPPVVDEDSYQHIGGPWWSWYRSW